MLILSRIEDSRRRPVSTVLEVVGKCLVPTWKERKRKK